jgi:hypothetical protein
VTLVLKEGRKEGKKRLSFGKAEVVQKYEKFSNPNIFTS